MVKARQRVSPRKPDTRAAFSRKHGATLWQSTPRRAPQCRRREPDRRTASRAPKVHVRVQIVDHAAHTERREQRDRFCSVGRERLPPSEQGESKWGERVLVEPLAEVDVPALAKVFQRACEEWKTVALRNLATEGSHARYLKTGRCGLSVSPRLTPS